MNQPGENYRMEHYHHNNTSSNFTPPLKQGNLTVGNPSFAQIPLQKEKKDPRQYISKNQNQTSVGNNFFGSQGGAQNSSHKVVAKKQNFVQNIKMDKTSVVNNLKVISQAVKQTNFTIKKTQDTISKTQDTIYKTQDTIYKTQGTINQLISKQTLTEDMLDRLTKAVEGWDIKIEMPRQNFIEDIKIERPLQNFIESEQNTAKFNSLNSSSGGFAGQEINTKTFVEQNRNHGGSDKFSQNSNHSGSGLKKPPNLSPPHQGGFPKSLNVNTMHNVNNRNYSRFSPSQYNMKKTSIGKFSPGKNQDPVHYRNKSQLNLNKSASNVSNRGGIGSGNIDPPKISITINPGSNYINTTTQSVSLPISNDRNSYNRMNATFDIRREENSGRGRTNNLSSIGGHEFKP